MNCTHPSFLFLVKLLTVIAAVVILYFGSQLLIPLVYAALFALLIVPLVNKLLRIGFSDFLAIVVSVILLLVVFAGTIGIIIWQSAEMGENTKKMEQKFDSLYKEAQHNISSYIGYTPAEQEAELDEALEKVPEKAFDFVSGASLVLSDWLLTFVYIVVLLVERKRIKKVALNLIDSQHKNKALQSMDEISATVKDYLYGQFLVTLILAIAYAIGFYILGIQFSVILAIIAAILTFIPYLGNILGGIMVVFMGFMSGLELEGIIYIIIFLSVVQLIESYILKPWIIGNEIGLNIFAVIFSIVAFTILWGIAGSIIALPLTSIVRIIFFKIEGLKPFAYLISDRKTI